MSVAGKAVGDATPARAWQPVRVVDDNGNPVAGSGGGGDASAANQTTQIARADTLNTRTGDVTETAPTTDTASSGLNGRLQRIAQRLTSLIALFPVSIGQKNGAGSFSVVLASDQGSVPVSSSIASYPTLPTGTKRTGTATTTSSQFVAANTSRKSLVIQNLSTTATLYVDEFGGTVTAGSASYTVGPLLSCSIQTQNAVTVLSSTGTINLNGTET